MHKPIILLCCLLLSARLWADESTLKLRSQALPPLPVPVTNNAVTAVMVGATEYLVSFGGIGSGLKYSDTHARTFVLASTSDHWLEQAPVPGAVGRLAATATSVGELAYVFGGYSVAEDGSETSTSWTHSFNPQTGVFTELARMPVPVDDAVSVPYRGRYIYLLSGWHDSGNVNLVQRYDTVADAWSQATPIPGTALFGHAGGIVSGSIIYCDGVAVLPHVDRPRSFAASDQCWLGKIDDENSRRIDWRPVGAHPGLPRYRMAAAGVPELNAVFFLGGSENPYNFDGMGYNGKPSEPAPQGLLFNLETLQWQVINQYNAASMDHRGLVPFQGGWITVGGIVSGQVVTDTVKKYLLR